MFLSERDEIEIPKDVQLSCDGDYARIPVDCHLQVIQILLIWAVRKVQAHLASLFQKYDGWAGAKYGAGTYAVGEEELTLTGGTMNTLPNSKTLGAKMCMTMPSSGYLTFGLRSIYGVCCWWNCHCRC